jgi:hypothetical protein
MEVAAQAHRDRIRGLTAVPPLLMDDDMLQLQTRCAIMEQEAEDFRAQLQAYREHDSVGKLATLQKRMEETQKELEEQTATVEAMTREKNKLLKDKSRLQLRATDVDAEVRKMKRAMQLDEKEAEANQRVTLGLKERLDTAEGELERLKRKRKVSPDRVVTGILKHPGASPPSVQKSTKTDTPPASAQPAPKKSRTRRNRFEERTGRGACPSWRPRELSKRTSHFFQPGRW